MQYTIYVIICSFQDKVFHHDKTIFRKESSYSGTAQNVPSLQGSLHGSNSQIYSTNISQSCVGVFSECDKIQYRFKKVTIVHQKLILNNHFTFRLFAMSEFLLKSSCRINKYQECCCACYDIKRFDFPTSVLKIVGQKHVYDNAGLVKFFHILFICLLCVKRHRVLFYHNWPQSSYFDSILCSN